LKIDRVIVPNLAANILKRLMPVCPVTRLVVVYRAGKG
jgi:hypothetical protein